MAEGNLPPARAQLAQGAWRGLVILVGEVAVQPASNGVVLVQVIAVGTVWPEPPIRAAGGAWPTIARRVHGCAGGGFMACWAACDGLTRHVRKCNRKVPEGCGKGAGGDAS